MRSSTILRTMAPAISHVRSHLWTKSSQIFSSFVSSLALACLLGSGGGAGFELIYLSSDALQDPHFAVVLFDEGLRNRGHVFEYWKDGTSAFGVG